MPEQKRTEKGIFTLLLIKDREALTFAWEPVLKELISWGRDCRVSFLDLPTEKKVNGDELSLLIKLNTDDLLNSMARLHGQLYELSVNLELNRQ